MKIYEGRDLIALYRSCFEYVDMFPFSTVYNFWVTINCMFCISVFHGTSLNYLVIFFFFFYILKFSEPLYNSSIIFNRSPAIGYSFSSMQFDPTLIV